MIELLNFLSDAVVVVRIQRQLSTTALMTVTMMMMTMIGQSTRNISPNGLYALNLDPLSIINRSLLRG